MLRLVELLFDRLDTEELVSERAKADHARLLRGSWHMPMYAIVSFEQPVCLERLATEVESWAEVGAPGDHA